MHEGDGNIALASILIEKRLCIAGSLFRAPPIIPPIIRLPLGAGAGVIGTILCNYARLFRANLA